MAESFNVKSLDEWNGAIESLEKAKETMIEAKDKLKAVVSESLLQVGITGDVATSLMTSFEADVVSSMDNFITEVGTFISSHKTAYQGASDAKGTIDGAVANMM